MALGRNICLLYYKHSISIVHISFQQDKYKNEFENDTENRLKVMKGACHFHGLDRKGDDPLHQPNPWEYFIAETNSINLVWCNVFKSASSR